MTEPSKPSPTHRILLILVLPWMLPILTPYEEHSIRRVCSPMRPPRVPRIMTPHHTTRHCTVYCTSSRGAIAQNRLTDRPTAPPRPSRRRLLHSNLPSLVRHQRRKHERKENSRCVHDSGAIPDAGGGGGGGGGGGAGGRGGLAHTSYVKMVHASSARESVPTQLPHALALLIQLLSCEKPCLQLSNSR